ncbi:hypothetical protein [Novosphingobium sp. Chol11]|uniref:hypothetical protein n=1 Tax=Novosphingobium sp. Chol11 TaxID=1385763 RepID=UPI0026014EAD|nr:hypothetical protein [Novosphingobium sp. Chol11]
MSIIAAATRLFPAHAQAQAQNFQIGETVTCYGYTGPILRLEPRPGRDPFFIVYAEGTGTSNEIRCVAKEMKRAAALPSFAQLCRPGTKLEAAWGISWKEATVLAAPNSQGQCRVSFDGYDSMWDSFVTAGMLRQRGSGPIVKPANPVSRTSAATAALPATAPNGTYKCHKILVGGQLGAVGTLSMRGGKGTANSLPRGWAIRSIKPRARDQRGRLVLAVDYQTASGNRDRMDCVLQ